jgi:hypothetical protein
MFESSIKTITGPGLGDQSPALCDLLGRIRAGRGVEQRQFNDPLRRLPHDLKANIAAHGDADERKARRRCREDSGGQRAEKSCDASAP